MSSIIKFQVINGAMDESPLCYLLQVDEYTFLLDCGWDEKFSMNIIDEYKKYIKAIDGVLLTFPDIQHMGALPYLVSKCGLNCPIYATIPVIKMGQMFMYDLYLSHADVENFDMLTLDDIDAAFDKIQQLKYHQSINLKDKGLGLQITPLQAGHMIGGTFWKILKEGEEEIIYAVDFNHQKERHLNSGIIDTISKPALLITDSYSITSSQQQQRRRTRDEKLLLDSILKALRNNGDVLMCTDTAGRVLELVHLLDQMWKREDTGLLAYTLCWLNHVSISVAGFAKSQVEWMNDKIVRSFEEVRYNPFQFKHVKLCSTLDEVYAVNGPKLIVASTPDMEYGFSRELFLRLCGNENNLIIFTMRASCGTLARNLIDHPEARKISINVKRKIRLEGKELEEYYKKIQEQELVKKNQNKKSKELESIDDGTSSTDDDEDDDDDDLVVDVLNADAMNTAVKHDILKAKASTKHGFFRHIRKNYPMFPYKEELIKWDDYGQLVKTNEYCVHDQYSNSNLQDAGQMESSADNAKLENAGDQRGSADNKDDLNIDTPSKTVCETCSINLLAKILYIDFDGRSDGDSIKKIIANIKPKNLIIIHGTQKSTYELAEYCRKAQIVQDKIFTPSIGEIVDATSETQMYQIKLNDNIINNIKFEKSKDYELAWIDGLIKARDMLKDKQIVQMPSISKSLDLEYNLESLNKGCLVNTKRKCIFVNEPKLSDLKQTFVKNGFSAEFHGGVLVCNNLVALRKNETGRIILEGVVCDDYYKIRSILYNEYAVI